MYMLMTKSEADYSLVCLFGGLDVSSTSAMLEGLGLEDGRNWRIEVSSAMSKPQQRNRHGEGLGPQKEAQYFKS